jgi:hypothetical protein
MSQFKTSSWSAEKIADCKKELDTLFREAVGYGNGKHMNPRASDVLHKDRFDIAQTITTFINQVVENINPLPFLVQEVTGDIRDQYTWQELDGTLRVVDRSYGSKPLSQRLTFKEHSMRTSMKETAVEIPLEEVFSGRLTPSMAAEEMALTITRYRVSMVLDALDAGIPSSTDDRTGLTGYTLRYTCAGALAQSVVDKALDGLYDEGENATMFGRHIAFFPAMRAFTNSAGVSGLNENTGREFFERGQVATYHGARVVVLRDPLSQRHGEHLIPKNKVWVASSQANGTGGLPGAIFMRKPVDFLNWTVVDPRTATWGQGIRWEDGLLVRDPYLYRLITITGI